MIFFFPLKMFPKGSVSSCSLLQRLRVNNIPQQMPLFYSVEALPSTPPLPQHCPASPTSTTPESYLDRPGRAAKGFVKLPSVISPARRITAEPTHTQTHTHTHTHTLMLLHAAPLSSAAFISTLAAAGDEFSPASDGSKSNSLLLWLTRYSHFHRANFDEFLFSWLLLTKKMFGQPVINNNAILQCI